MTGAPAQTTRPLKVVRIIARLNIGGPARHVVLLESGLTALGYATVLAHGTVSPGEAVLPESTHATGRRVVIASFGSRVRFIDDLRTLRALTSLLFRERPDIVHTHTAKAGTLGRLAALVFNAARPRAQRALVVHTFHGNVFEGYFSRPVSTAVRAVERGLAAVSDRIVAISPRQRSDLVERLRVTPDDRTVTIPLGLDLDRLLTVDGTTPTLRAELQIAPDVCVIGYVGRLVPIKAVDVLIRAFAIVHRDHPRTCLLIVGDGPTRQVLASLATAIGLSEHVRFTGWTSALGSVYATIDICALSSLNEGTPVALIEAMAAGRPAVAPSVGGVSDVLVDGVTGRLVTAHGSEALAEALSALVEAPAERARLGDAARSHVGSRYAPARLLRDIDELYRSALEEKRAGQSVNPRERPARGRS